jgi:Zn-dependent protease with chaperone function
MAVVFYNSTDPDVNFFNPQWFVAIAGVTFAVICISSLIKIAALSKGGSYIAEGLGGKLVSLSSKDSDQRKLINVVEEMALASGVPVPPVYLLEDEEGINAFAAGFSPNDAVIGVTKGCCEKLSRNELQGVIAHEYSHILNGDMRLNIRLIGFLSGIMVISTIGNTILRSSRYHSNSSAKSKEKKSGQVFIIAFLLLVIGYAGMLIGRLIQSAVCRQREYLADASAVQFTRSTGIADALKKIGGFSLGSTVASPAAGEACHMFFVKAISSPFSTHPPLIERIQKIEPGFKNDFKNDTLAKVDLFQGALPFQPQKAISIDADAVMRQVGNITSENLAYGAAVLEAIPKPIRNETYDILGAWAIACALLLDKDPVEKAKQLNKLQQSAFPSLFKQIVLMDEYVKNIAPDLKLPVLDISIPALRQMSPEQFKVFKNHIQLLIEADSKITIFEFSLKEVINHRLEAAFVNADPKILYKSVAPLIDDAVTLLTVLAQAGHKDKETVRMAFRTSISFLLFREKKDIKMPAKVNIKTLHAALKRFSQASFKVKEAIFRACCQCVLFDDEVTVSEAELLRAVAYALDIPLPPFMKKL